MNITKIIAIAAALLIAFSSCKKDKHITPEPAKNNYPFLKVGNYVVYETVFIDSLGKETLTGRDSSFVEKDTVINGYTYFKQVNSNLVFSPEVEYLRDSSGYLVNTAGKKVGSNGLPQPVSYFQMDGGDTVFEVHAFTKPADTTITVPAGTFKVNIVVNRLVEHMKDSVKKYFTADFNTFINKQNGIIISRRYAYMLQFRLEKAHYDERLVRYKVD